MSISLDLELELGARNKLGFKLKYLDNPEKLGGLVSSYVSGKW